MDQLDELENLGHMLNVTCNHIRMVRRIMEDVLTYARKLNVTNCTEKELKPEPTVKSLV